MSENIEVVAALAAEIKPMEDNEDSIDPMDAQTETHLAMLSKSVSANASSSNLNINANGIHPPITSSSSSTTKDTLPHITNSSSGTGLGFSSISKSNSSFSNNLTGNGTNSISNILELLSGKSLNSLDNIDPNHKFNGSSSNLTSLTRTPSKSVGDSNNNTNNIIPSTPSNNNNNNVEMKDDSNNQQNQNNQQQMVSLNSNVNDKQITQMKPEGEKENFVDITEYLNLPQIEAAKKLGIPTSTLSKRWKEASVNRKWPYRTVAKLDKEIMTLLHNIPQGPEAPPLPAEIENNLGNLLRKRQDELRTVVIRI